MELTHDIWREIADLLADQSDKRTLLSLALVSRTSSIAALPALWRDLSSREIIFTINSFVPEDDHFLVFHAPDESNGETPGGRWGLSHPIPEFVRVRMSEYLSYVRSYVHDSDPCAKRWDEDKDLWPLLPVWLGLDSTLFPHLRHLSVYLDEEYRTEALLSLLCPSISHLEIEFSEDIVGPQTISTILDAIVNVGCVLRRLLFCGQICLTPLLSTPSAFKHLRHLEIVSYIFQHLELSSRVSIVDLLSSLPSLNHFFCGVDTYIMPPLGSAVICHDSLVELYICATASDIEKFLLGFRFPLLSEIDISVIEGAFPRLKRLHETITSRSPMIRQFSLLCNTLDPNPPTLDDLTPLFGLALESVDCRISKAFTASDVETLVKSLPNLRKLTLLAPTCFRAAEIYIILSQHPRLEDLEVPVDLQDLLSPSALDHATVGPRRYLPSKSSMWSLRFHSLIRLPSETPQIESLVKNLLELFLRLLKVYARFDLVIIKEMERIILALKTDVV